jgi:hypothetical protein
VHGCHRPTYDRKWSRECDERDLSQAIVLLALLPRLCAALAIIATALLAMSSGRSAGVLDRHDRLH